MQVRSFGEGGLCFRGYCFPNFSTSSKLNNTRPLSSAQDFNTFPVVVLPKGQIISQHIYKDLILKQHFLPAYRQIKRLYNSQNKPVYLRENKASYFTAGIPEQYRRSQEAKSLGWPTQSPNLSPIENLWKIAKDRIARRRHKIKSLEQMGNAIVEELSKISGDLLEKLAMSFINRLDLCIKAKDGATKY